MGIEVSGSINHAGPGYSYYTHLEKQDVEFITTALMELQRPTLAAKCEEIVKRKISSLKKELRSYITDVEQEPQQPQPIEELAG
jgi:hypothetical protein